MDGIELYDQLQSTKEFQDIPAIIISANLPKRALDTRSLVGLRKPLELSELLKMILSVAGGLRKNGVMNKCEVAEKGTCFPCWGWLIRSG